MSPPSMPGMSMSHRMRSGCWARARPSTFSGSVVATTSKRAPSFARMKSSTASSSSTTRILCLAILANFTRPARRILLGRGGALDEAHLRRFQVPAHELDALGELVAVAGLRRLLEHPALGGGPLEAVEREAAGEL